MMTNSKTDKEKTLKMGVQSISEADLAIILALHQKRLGWAYLLENTIADRLVGFPCETEEFFIRRQLKVVVRKVSEWFRTMGRQNNWPSMEGWMWEIDFESSQAVPKKQRPQMNSVGAEQKDSQCSLLVEGPIMTLGDIDVDVIKRLLEKRNALSDSIRSQLRLVLDGDGTIDESNDLVAQLGAADKDVKDWFSEMAVTYKWPQTENSNWMYRVDISEKQVYLARM